MSSSWFLRNWLVISLSFDFTIRLLMCVNDDVWSWISNNNLICCSWKANLGNSLSFRPSSFVASSLSSRCFVKIERNLLPLLLNRRCCVNLDGNLTCRWSKDQVLCVRIYNWKIFERSWLNRREILALLLQRKFVKVYFWKLKLSLYFLFEGN